MLLAHVARRAWRPVASTALPALSTATMSSAAIGATTVASPALAAAPLPGRRWMSDIPVQHRDTPDNNDKTPFDFTLENYRKVEAILSRYPKDFKKSAVIPLLDLAQRQNENFLTLSAMNKVAQICEMPPMLVYEVATFYTMFNRHKVGKFFIQLCGTTPCMVCGSNDIKNAITEHLGIEDGEMTKDGMFSLLEVECLGACANAPMVQINDDFFECLTPESMKGLLDDIRAKGKLPPMTKWGSKPMNGQYSCEGPMGKTSLKSAPTFPPPCDALDKAEKKVDPKQVMDDMYGKM